ncbi:hypothetical protein CWE09_01435 [Aliidiomarina minuta]|uniref:Methylated-DNA-[protein]-cysteine S-methyltransferase DNA binding domain-containing protein n=1 Tax=Aliidiomarina minuta TaxID=880057 RepID=A0A432W620_9GAMM|nr:methylated-DNA--[protein]-cysteine S-methyltransferase [Aliidiomarina minuta]RUO25426.1 hypothetical protein CWE09_01435 [Aliidiomarina minuta]
MNLTIIPFADLQLSIWFSDTELYASSLALSSGQFKPVVHPLIDRVQEQLGTYLRQSDYSFDLPLAPEGTDFQCWVWQQMSAIPAGQVRTYGEIAKLRNSAARAVGGACRANPLPLFIPCHRIVSRSGIGGYSGQWQEGERIDVKRWLLTHEGAVS